MIRIGTRLPVWPADADHGLAGEAAAEVRAALRDHPLHHPKEITPEAREACERLVDHGVPVENQAVLMRRVNSSARIIKELSHRCLQMRVRPYYLHQMDVAEGLEHLRTPLRTGVEILEQLRGHTTGPPCRTWRSTCRAGGVKVTLQPELRGRARAGGDGV